MHPTTHVNAKASGSIKNQEFCVKDRDVITGGALEHCSITVLHCNTLFFKGICTLTGWPSIRDRETSSAPVCNLSNPIQKVQEYCNAY
jgi:hypothetical protein